MLKDIPSLEFTLFVIKRFTEDIPQEEWYFMTVVNQAKFHKLLDEEQVESNLKNYAHFKDNWEHPPSYFFPLLAYFVGSSTRIVHLDKWFSGQRLRIMCKCLSITTCHGGKILGCKMESILI